MLPPEDPPELLLGALKPLPPPVLILLGALKLEELSYDLLGVTDLL